MSKYFVFYFILILNIAAIGQVSERHIQNIMAFAKLYGYVRYFHPSDQAQNIEWDKFAGFGCANVQNCHNDSDLVRKLQSLFSPFSPSLIVAENNTDFSQYRATLNEWRTKSDKPVYWQHVGLGKNERFNVFESKRINAFNSNESTAADFGAVYNRINVSDFQFRRFVFTAKVKESGDNLVPAHLFVREELLDGSSGFFENMYNKPIFAREFKTYSISGTLSPECQNLYFGAYTGAGGQISFGNVKLEIEDESGVMEVVYNSDSDRFKDLQFKGGVGQAAGGLNVVFNNYIDSLSGEKFIKISSKPQNVRKKLQKKKLFDEELSVGDYFEHSLNSNIKCLVPICLPGKNGLTVPLTDTTKLRLLVRTIKTFNANDMKNIANRQGNVVILYNVIKHFHPYANDSKINLDSLLSLCLIDCENDLIENVLNKFLVALKDGHANIKAIYEPKKGFPDIKVDIVEDKVIVSKTFDSNLDLPVGSIISSINSRPINEILSHARQKISAPTQGWLNYRLGYECISGSLKDTISLKFETPDNKIIFSKLLLKNTLKEYDKKVHNTAKYKNIDGTIFYINLDQISISEFYAQMKNIQAADYLIFDLRGYPNSNAAILRHLLRINDTCDNWMHTPLLLYPDFKNARFLKEGWNIKRKKPDLSSKKIFFLTDGSAISFAESILGFVNHYKLGTIIGQPTAGTNGNASSIYLPGGFLVRYTGMKVTYLNGMKHYNIGIIPDILVHVTIEDIKAGRDAILEKALEQCKAQ